MAQGVKVKPREAERVKRELLRLNALDRNRKVKREGGFVIFPVTEEMAGFETVNTNFEGQERKKFKDYLREFLPSEKAEHVLHSFDVIGDIAIVEVPEELGNQQERIAQSLMAAHKNIKTVFRKTSKIRGEERLRGLKFLAGDEKTETLHREHGCVFKLDVANVYFSPRLSYERQRVLEQARDGEVVVDLFAGIGPFSIILARYRDLKAYAVDVNPSAYEYLKVNARMNKVEDKVVPLLGDCREIAPRSVATRVIMNLPKSSHEFLDLAFEVLTEGVVHFYSISSEDDLYDSKVELIRRVAREKGRSVEVLNKRIVRAYAPRMHHVAIDFHVN